MFDSTIRFDAIANDIAGLAISCQSDILLSSTRGYLNISGSSKVAGLTILFNGTQIRMTNTRLAGKLSGAGDKAAILIEVLQPPVNLYGAGYCYSGEFNDPTETRSSYIGILKNCAKAEFIQCMVTQTETTIEANRIKNGVVFSQGYNSMMDIHLNLNQSFVQTNFTLYGN